MATVSIRNVWKYYGETPAVKDLNITCPDGSFVSILGPSGCGKSSTMRMIAGLEHISSGDIMFDDVRVNDLAPKDRDVAMVFENYALYPHKSVYENIANPLRLRGASESTVKERVEGAAKLLEISHLLGRRPHELSGGQKQRVAIGRAIVREPKLFLFDEPIAHLDAKLRAHMRGEIKHLQRTLGTTMIYVTHDQLEALSMADYIAVMHDGELQQWGTPSEIFNNPVNAWVAGFVGEPAMNFLTCGIKGEGDAVSLMHKNFEIPLLPGQVRQLNGAAQTGVARMGVRPDALSISMTKPSEAAIRGEIFVNELLGGDMLVEVELDDCRIRVKTTPEFAGKPGEACYLTVNRDKWHVFDAGDGHAYF
ncbi:ABC transporter ATP-binding protein [Rhodobacteraceae bacterium HSP-20]|uniref:ABC transporter ATP-binding protein n=1 Tax=Paragemmobacter amnigenus TaxID=2852097 RepID=A0ABS6J574_9RHOB|nr:ABC transporter ATP-binding protein [Rhodobacter amnigenus]MBU9698748.1 ABC transporter ATP-binding protein [Rhodobacter amnigenus]MBV4389975.1 ABC transporter ATP-binding protein [Rhodobacter amnigenus]